jgi:hypothetical protein
MAIAYISNSLANKFNSLVSPIAMDAIGWNTTIYILRCWLNSWSSSTTSS